jgi:hypothetical protein
VNILEKHPQFTAENVQRRGFNHSSFWLSMPDISLAETEPSRGCHFLLREKLHSFFALHVQIAKKRFVPAVERKPGHRCRDSNIYAYHPAIDAMLKLPGGLA